jgi:hypothetical protein
MVGIINPTSIPKTQHDGYGMVKVEVCMELWMKGIKTSNQ